MGSFFNNGGSRNKPRYERLPLETFYSSDSTNITRYGDHDADNLLFELGDLGQNGRLLPSTRHDYDSEEEIEFYKDSGKLQGRQTRRCCGTSRCRLMCLLVVLIIVVVLFGAVYFVGPRRTNKETNGWASSTYEYATETAVRLYDVNLDGVQDIILGAATTASIEDIDNEEFCKSINMKYPCAGIIMAFDGRSGTILWTIATRVEIFAVQCGKLDINSDGHMDCIAAGRMGTLHGIDPIEGLMLWSVDPNVTNPYFNFYQGQVIPDLDQDGVVDFVVTHGGDTRLSEKDVNRPAGRLILLSGKTGKSLGRWMSIPDGHETYSSITLYERHNGTVYLLFGSGGETIQGSLWMISLRDLYCYVTSTNPCNANHLAHVPVLQNGYDEHWGAPIQTLPSGLKEIIRSGNSKGVIIPTELVDMNNDGVDDLIVFMYNSNITVLDGVNLKVIWTTGSRFAQFETYSNPAPGYFNDDDTLDLMVRLSEGTWPKFKSSHVYILDGRNGEVLWSLKTSGMAQNHIAVMSSPLTIQSSGHKDAFLFWVQGLDGKSGEGGFKSTGDGVGSGDSGASLIPMMRHRRHGHDDENDDDRRTPCHMDMAIFHADLLLMDRDLALNPLRLATMDAFTYNYTLTDKDRLHLPDDLHHEPVAMETASPDSHVISPSQPTTVTNVQETVTEEDLARHDLHRHSTTASSVDAVTMPEGHEPTQDAVTTPGAQQPTTDAVTMPGGHEPTQDAVTTPGAQQPTTDAVTMTEGQELTTDAVTTPGVWESNAASTSEIMSATTNLDDTSFDTTTSITTNDIETTTIQLTDGHFGTETKQSTALTTQSETTQASNEYTTLHTAKDNGMSYMPESTLTSTAEITTENLLQEATTQNDLSTPEESSQTVGREEGTKEITTNKSASDTSGMNASQATSEMSKDMSPNRTTPAPQTDSETPKPTPDGRDQRKNVSGQNLTAGTDKASGIEGTISDVIAEQSVRPTEREFDVGTRITTAEAEIKTTPPEDVTSPPEVTRSPSDVNFPTDANPQNKLHTHLRELVSASVIQSTVSQSQIPDDSKKDQDTVQKRDVQRTLERDSKVPASQRQDEDTAEKSDADGGDEQRRRRRELVGGNLCTPYFPNSFSTGIIGDLDDEGNLDYVYAESHIANLIDENFSYISSKQRLAVHRLVIDTAIKRRDWVRLGEDQVMLNKDVRVAKVDWEKLDGHFQFLPAKKQSWTSYMGKDVDGKFKKNNR